MKKDMKKERTHPVPDAGFARGPSEESIYHPLFSIFQVQESQKPFGNKLRADLREALKLRHYSQKTYQAYWAWIQRFILFHQKRHPRSLGPKEITAFLTHLASTKNVSASTQNQALSALLFLYRNVLNIPFPKLDKLVHAKRPKTLPSVLSPQEVQALLAKLNGPTNLMASLLYGAGLRLLECCQLRIQDLDFSTKQIHIHAGKGKKDRFTILPSHLKPALQKHILQTQEMHNKDLQKGAGWVALPSALHRKYPNAGKEWSWQWVFPATRSYYHKETQQTRRHHLHETVLQCAVRKAAKELHFSRRITCHTLPHSFATHLFQRGQDIRTIQELLGHKDVKTTMIYTHVLNRGGLGVQSPLDDLFPHSMEENES